MTLDIYYTRNSYKYTVNYYFNDELDEELTEVNKALFESEITEYTDKVKENYTFSKVENLPLIISDNEEDNIINVYYVMNEKEIPIEIPQTGVNLNSKNGYGILMILFNLLSMCFISRKKED